VHETDYRQAETLGRCEAVGIVIRSKVDVHVTVNLREPVAQVTTVGRGILRRPGVQASRRPGVQASRRPGVQASRRPGVQASRRPGVEASRVAMPRSCSTGSAVRRSAVATPLPWWSGWVAIVSIVPPLPSISMSRIPKTAPSSVATSSIDGSVRDVRCGWRDGLFDERAGKNHPARHSLPLKDWSETAHLDVMTRVCRTCPHEVG
jgi:hypothetical protein